MSESLRLRSLLAMGVSAAAILGIAAPALAQDAATEATTTVGEDCGQGEGQAEREPLRPADTVVGRGGVGEGDEQADRHQQDAEQEDHVAYAYVSLLFQTTPRIDAEQSALPLLDPDLDLAPVVGHHRQVLRVEPPRRVRRPRL